MPQGVYNPVTDMLRQVPCPAGEAIGDVLGSSMPNTPGVRCRITHESLSVEKDARTIVRWCASPCGGTMMRDPVSGVSEGYAACPVWAFDRDRIMNGRKSFGDPDEAADQAVRTWRDDLTGSEYGDTSWWDGIDDMAQAAVDVATGHAIGAIES